MVQRMDAFRSAFFCQCLKHIGAFATAQGQT